MIFQTNRQFAKVERTNGYLVCPSTVLQTSAHRGRTSTWVAGLFVDNTGSTHKPVIISRGGGVGAQIESAHIFRESEITPDVFSDRRRTKVRINAKKTNVRETHVHNSFPIWPSPAPAIFNVANTCLVKQLCELLSGKCPHPMVAKKTTLKWGAGGGGHEEN